MSFYNKSTNFAVKDSLTTGDPNKIVSGVEIDTEFTNIASGFSSVESTKVDIVGSAVAGNVATLTSDGNIQDSGKTPYDEDVLKTDLNATGDAPIYAARAWAQFLPSTVINGSGNVSSIASLGNFQFRVNFETDIEDANYSVVGSAGGDQAFSTVQGTITTSSFDMYSWDFSQPGFENPPIVFLAVFR